MTYIEFVAAAIAALFIVLTFLRQSIPWLDGAGSKYIPLFTLALGIGLAFYLRSRYGLDVLEVLITCVIPMLASSGVNSIKNVVKDQLPSQSENPSA